ncbi:hypothetical protein DPMN_168932 [Dreissena polymorpha]|uniref:Uncharacterized protein n=1 Tax=Dreissena polymorpha TaxID=45954 RepID=A0A9D4F6H9_DREPO|nr:hypothetical protein DPMN_168932 [Dreissena polymorpha]
MSETGTYSFIRQLLCLPLLPAEHIRPTFDMMSGLNTARHITPLVEYMYNTWISSTVWPVESWSVYGHTVRTNNDVEGNLIFYFILLIIVVVIWRDVA